MTFSLRIFDVAVSVETADEDLEEFLRQLWEPFLSSARELPVVTVGIDRAAEGWEITHDGTSQRVAEPWGLSLDLRVVLDDVVRRFHPNLVDVHAAMAEVAGSAVLFPGDPGAGKTTLLLAGLERGWSFCCDDLGFLDPGTGGVIPLPRPIGIRAGVPISGFAHRWKPPEWLPEPEGRPYGLPASAFPIRTSTDPVVPSFIIFPTYRTDSNTELRKLADAETLARLGRHVDPLTPQALVQLRSLCAGCTGAVLDYASPSEGVDEVNRLVIRSKA